MALSGFYKTSFLRLLIYSISAFVVIILLFPRAFSGQYNGFIIKQPLVPLDEIHHGGPARDGIPSIDQPQFMSAKLAGFLQPEDRILGIHIGTTYKAYPVRILNWHEIVNDGDLLISYCPLCGTGMAFKTTDANFGVSGLLYNSDMLLYDRETRSLWSQILAQAISGERKGQRLNAYNIENTSWSHWLKQHPDTLVLSNRTGYFRDYTKSPYANYESSSALYFPVAMRSQRFHPKERVIGIQINNLFKAYPFVELDKSNDNIIQDEIDGQKIEIHFNSLHRSGSIKLASGETLPTITGYWFAWFAFHPETEVYTHQN